LKGYEKTVTPTCPVPTAQPVPAVPTVSKPPALMPSLSASPATSKVPAPSIPSATSMVPDSPNLSSVPTNTPIPSAATTAPLPTIPSIPNVTISPATRPIQPVPTTPSVPTISDAPALSIVPLLTFNPVISVVPSGTIAPTGTLIPLQTIAPTGTLIPLQTIAPTAALIPLQTSAPSLPTDPASSRPSVFTSLVPASTVTLAPVNIAPTTSSPTVLATTAVPVVPTGTTAAPNLASSIPSLIISDVPVSGVTSSPTNPFLVNPLTGVPSTGPPTQTPGTPVSDVTMAPTDAPVTAGPPTQGSIGAPTQTPGTPVGDVTVAPTGAPVTGPADLSDIPSAVPTTNIISTKDGVVETSTPSPSPSSTLLFNMNVDETVYEKSVGVGEILRVVSEFDPWDKQDELSIVVKSGFTPYSAALLGEFLKNVTVSMHFLQDLTTVDRSIQESATGTVATFYMAINVTFVIVSTVESDVDDFTQINATPIVQHYFDGEMKSRLLARLQDNGMTVKELNVLNAAQPQETINSNIGVAAPVPVATVNQSSSDETVLSTKSDDGSKMEANSRKHSIVKPFAISGAIAIVILGVVLLTAKRRRMQNKGRSQCLPSSKLDLCKNSPNDSSFNDDEEQSKALSYVTDSTKNTGNISTIIITANSNKRKTTTTTTIRTAPISTQKDTAAKERSYRSSSARFFSSKASSATVKKTTAREYLAPVAHHQQQQQFIRHVDSSEDLIRFEDGPDLVANTEFLLNEEHVAMPSPTTTEFSTYQLIRPSLSSFSGLPSTTDDAWPRATDDVSVSTPVYSIAACSNLDEDEHTEPRRNKPKCINELDIIPSFESDGPINDNKSDVEGTTNNDNTGKDNVKEECNLLSFSDDLLDMLEDVNLVEETTKATNKATTNTLDDKFNFDVLLGDEPL
jgi:hypothetical protein